MDRTVSPVREWPGALDVAMLRCLSKPWVLEPADATAHEVAFVEHALLPRARAELARERGRRSDGVTGCHVLKDRSRWPLPLRLRGRGLQFAPRTSEPVREFESALFTVPRPRSSLPLRLGRRGGYRSS